MIGQQVCFQCPLTGSNFSWTFQDTPILPAGAEGFANGTLVINGVAQDHLDPAFFRCVADDFPSDPYRLVEACELHARMFPSSVLAFLCTASPFSTCSQHLTCQKSPTVAISLSVCICVGGWPTGLVCGMSYITFSLSDFVINFFPPSSFATG